MNLTPQQQAVVDADVSFLLLACPGSGKTRAAAERTARLVGTAGTKVAVCSYTNVGAERIGAVLSNELRVVLGREHFLGTIHKFLLRYIVHPYAHLLGAAHGPFIHEGDWPEVRVHGENTQRIALDKFRCTADGELVLCEKPRGVSGTPDEIIASVGEEVRRRKNGFFQHHGLLTADDAMWIALKILRKYPGIAEAVAGRFDELLLDEAQDTSELQLACIEVVHATGRLRSLVLVGDLEQSIFSFQGASAARCQQLAVDLGLSVLQLTENHRSSQLICNVAFSFCSRDAPDTAVGPHRDCSIQPEVALYPANDPAVAMETYRARLHGLGLVTGDAVVLARHWKIIDSLNGQTPLFKKSDRQYVLGGLAARLADGSLTAGDVRAAQRLVAYCAWGVVQVDTLPEEQRIDLRRAASTLLGQLPPLRGDLRSWLVEARGVLHDVAASLIDGELAHTGGRAVTAGAGYAEHRAVEVFSPAPRDLHARTVHSFKGEDSDAVMVVVRRPHASDPTSQLELWEAAVAGTEIDPEKAEERRVLFVALTRARRYCLVALPDDRRGRAVAGACSQLGFDVVTAS
jgi:DNA helicase-2/ATP-dependent DNA helicase PcrA